MDTLNNNDDNNNNNEEDIISQRLPLDKVIIIIWNSSVISIN